MLTMFGVTGWKIGVPQSSVVAALIGALDAFVPSRTSLRVVEFIVHLDGGLASVLASHGFEDARIRAQNKPERFLHEEYPFLLCNAIANPLPAKNGWLVDR